MRVCKHGCDVKMFSFLCANHASTNLNKFLSWNLEKFTLFTCSLIGWNLENLYKHAVSNFFTWTDISSAKNPYFGKHPFSKTRTDMPAILTRISKIWPPYHVVASSPQKFLATDQIIISGKSTLSSLGRQKTLTHNLFNIYVQICTNIFGTSRTEGGLPVVFAGHILISSWFTQTLPAKHNYKFCCPSAKCF